MNERDPLHIERMQDEIDFLEKNLIDVSKEEFIQNSILQRAIAMSLINIGECAHRLSDNFREENAYIEWGEIIATRNIAAHGYWQLKMELVWDTVKEDVPRLRKFLDEVSI